MRVAFVGVQSSVLLTFRAEMLRGWAGLGHTVLAISPEDDPHVRSELAAMHVGFAAVPLTRAGLNPVRDARTVVALTRRLRRFRPDAILVAGAKPVIYGSIAAWLARVPLRAALITGVGSALGGGTGARRGLLAAVVRGLYKVGLARVHVVFFQNPDDQRLFESLGLVGRRHRLIQVGGSGVDLDEFATTPLPDPPITFLMVARLLRDKGLFEYVAAAEQVKAARPDARFALLGPLDPNPDGISSDELEAIKLRGAVDYLGTTVDVRPFLAAAHVFVLPSYREGTPRSALEAMAMGRPILTTDAPGCRETVIPGQNGLSVPVRDVDALAAAMRELIDAPERLAAMGNASRQLAESRFDVRIVNRTILDGMGLATG